MFIEPFTAVYFINRDDSFNIQAINVAHNHLRLGFKE